MTDTLSKPVAISLVAHVALVAFFLVTAYMAPNDIDMRQVMRVDIVGLPDKVQTLPEKAPAPAPIPKAPPPVTAAKPHPKPEPAKPKMPALNQHSKKDVARSEKNALNRIKALEALDKIQKEVSTKKAAADKPVKGNQVNAGNDLSGLDKLEYDQYFHSIKNRVMQNWSLPQWLINAPLKAQALVLIDENGAIKKKQVLKSSGNSEFDDRMLEAIDKSAPFPTPPDRLRSVLAVKGIVFFFPQRGDS